MIAFILGFTIVMTLLALESCYGLDSSGNLRGNEAREL
jgi:hypothetical protein